MKQVALCLHDLRLSEGARLPRLVNDLRKSMDATALTCHLIANADPQENREALEFFRDEMEAGNLEVVFHGIAHRCPEGTGRPWAWYHKYQAEFLGTEFDASLNAARFMALQEAMRMRLGVCPPCWIAGKAGWAFLKSLDPLFLEGMLWMGREREQRFSPVVSLGGDSGHDLFWLRLAARSITLATRVLGFERLRLVVHPVDLERRGSLDFLRTRFDSLQALGFRKVLQRELL